MPRLCPRRAGKAGANIESMGQRVVTTCTTATTSSQEKLPDGSRQHVPQRPSPEVPANIGPWEPLVTLAEEFRYNQNFKQKVGMLLRDGYKGWRRIRGDGNCFYRAVGYAVLEHLIRCEAEPRKIKTGELHQKFSKLVLPHDSAEQLAHAEFLARLEILRDTGEWEPFNFGNEGASPKRAKPLESLYQSLVDPNETLDLAVIRALRIITANFLTEHANDADINEGLSFEMIVTQDYNSTEDFCKRVVLPMGVEAESLILTALPHALGLSLRVVFLDRQVPASGKLVTIDYPKDPCADEAGPSVHIQLRPGHYDLLYLSKDSESTSYSESI